MHINGRLPLNVELGAVRRERMNLDVAQQDGGYEKRNRLWSQFLGEYDVTYPIAKRNGPANASFATVKAAFRATGGGEHSFDFQDWADHTATDETFGIGDGTQTIFPLVKLYTWLGETHERRIYRPVSAITIEKEGVAVDPADFTVDYELGIVTFDVAVPVGEEVTWSGEFNVPVRFDKVLQSAAVTIQNEKYDTFTLIEVRLREADFA